MANRDSRAPSEVKTTAPKTIMVGGEFINAARRPPPKPSNQGIIALIISMIAIVLAVGIGALFLLSQPPALTEEAVRSTQTAVVADIAISVQQRADEIVEVNNRLDDLASLPDRLANVELTLTSDYNAQTSLAAEVQELEVQITELRATLDGMNAASTAEVTPEVTPELTAEATSEEPNEEATAEPLSSGAEETETPISDASVTSASGTAPSGITITVPSNVNIRLGPGVDDVYPFIATTSSFTVLEILGKVVLEDTISTNTWFLVSIVTDGYRVPGITMADAYVNSSITEGYVRSDLATPISPEVMALIPDIPQENISPLTIPSTATTIPLATIPPPVSTEEVQANPEGGG